MDIRPFRGWRYCIDQTDISDYIAPPYDVLSRANREALLARNVKNIVAVDLPHFPPREAGPKKEYEHAAWVLGEWKGEGTLRQDAQPALYAYEQEFVWGGKSFSRRALLCGVRATALGQDVIPHEHTYEGPKADRLELMRHTRMQLSPLLGFYEDPAGIAAETLWAAARDMPTVWGEMSGVTERLWVIDDAEAIDAVQAALRQVPVFIADGHHRYVTAMNYIGELRDAGRIDDQHEANFVLFALVPGDDPGLLVLPTHRILSGLRDEFRVGNLEAATPEFSWQRCSIDEIDLVDTGAFLRRYGRGAMAFLDRELAEVWIARLEDPRAMMAVAPSEGDAWREMDVAILHKLIIDQALGPWRTDAFFIEYTADGRAVRGACESGRAQLGICLQGTPLETVQKIALAGATMPHKSTYFYPKLATGIVLKPLE